MTSSRTLPIGTLVTCVLLLAAGVLYILLLSLSIGDYNRNCLLASIGVVLLAGVAVFIPQKGRPVATIGVLAAAIFTLAGVSFIELRVPSIALLPYWDPREISLIGRTAAIIAIGLPVCLALQHFGWRKSVVATVITLAAIQFFVCSHMFPWRAPEIDVWYVHHDSVTALAHGQNPYAITFENMHNEYGPDNSPLYSKEVQKNGRLMFGYQYPPLSLLLIYPSEMLTGDSRYSLTACYLAACVIVALTGGGLSLCAGLLLMSAPCAWLVFRDAWTEPQMILALACVCWTSLRRPKWLPVALGLLLSLKQYTVIFVPLIPLIMPRPLVSRASAIFLGQTLLTAAVVTLPLALWDWHAIWWSLVQVQVLQPFRPDSLNFLAMWARAHPGSPPPSTAIGFFVLIPVEAVLLWKLPRHAGGFCLGVALATLFFLLLGKQAFLNYHIFAAAALFVAVAGYEGMGWGDARSARG